MNILSLDALIGSLKTHEIELNGASKESNRRGKSIALKSTQRKTSSSKAMKAAEDSDEDEDESSEDDDDEGMRLDIWLGGYQKHGLRERRKA